MSRCVLRRPKPRLVYRHGTRRTAPRGADRNHAPRRLRAAGFTAGGHSPRGERPHHGTDGDVEVDVADAYSGFVIEQLGRRKGEMLDMSGAGGNHICDALKVRPAACSASATCSSPKRAARAR